MENKRQTYFPHGLPHTDLNGITALKRIDSADAQETCAIALEDKSIMTSVEGGFICPAFAHMRISEVTKHEKELQMQGDNNYGDSITTFRVQRK